MTPISLALIQTQKPLASKQVRSTNISSAVVDTLPLLKRYKNSGLEFYSELCINGTLGASMIFFGHDFSGCFGIDTEDHHIKYVTKEDGTIGVIFCNSTIGDFLYFNNSFIDLIHERIDAKSNDFETKITRLISTYSEKDPLAMEREENFWPLRTYELEEDFFPLDDSKINLYSKNDDQ
ncbi:SUKH-4 family immunity protein [Pantoea sp. Tr-811]|uniref:SUKH-4 family immunity protein n=1 Tax=Pantoea sp. Tr-811 TaxID=2608361 RepID=UPI001F0359A0|nr:SUKH-4 family immunity protein [Pantoea sp. Tr-811]